MVGTLAAHDAHAGSLVVGVNAWCRPPGMSQEEFVKQLAGNGVKTIRLSLPGSVGFIIQAYRAGIGTLAIVAPHTGIRVFVPLMKWQVGCAGPLSACDNVRPLP